MLERTRGRVSDFAADWGAPILLGLTTAAVVWTIWYITKTPCTAVAAANGLCNPGIVARFINVEILLQSGGAALAVGALKGGYDRAMMRRMINEEREARQQAEQQLAEARKRMAEERQENEQRAAEARQENEQRAAEARQENEQRAAEARQRNEQQAAEARQRNEEAFAMLTEMINELREERRQNAAIQQALLEAIIRLGQQNGGSGNGNGRSGNADA